MRGCSVQTMVELPSQQDKLNQAAALMAASQASPDNADLHAAIASLMSDLGRFDVAVGAGWTAVGLAPESGRAQAELGRALFLAGDVQAALQPSAQAVTLAPRNLGALVTFGAVLFGLGRFEEALEAADEAVMLDPDHFQARVNLALTFEGLGRLDEAEAQARIALRLNPHSPKARHNLAALRLSRGKLDKESWSLYDARLRLTPHARALDAIPRWRGEDVTGRTVLLHAEQGFGDMIQFARYAPMVRARGARVVLAVPSPLHRLMTGMVGVDQVVVPPDLPTYDVFCPVASLPGVLGTTLATIPADIPYLAAGSDDVDRLRQDPDGRLQVGLVWAGNPGFVHDRARSMPPERLTVLADVPGVRFHSLQKEGTPPFAMLDRMREVKDFADTAALIAGLDLVITVDTGLAHLAGSMGKPVWMLSRFMGCWRWMRDRNDSPWYPTMHIFRQARPGDWDGTVAQVRRALMEHAASCQR